MKKNPILTVLIILGITALFLVMVMTVILNFFGPHSSLAFSNKIGVIHIEGTISDPEPVLSQLAEFKNDKGIKAIILRIDSPGGGVGASQEIYREVQKTKEIKKVIISLGGTAASGGYYIASAGDKIVANPGTITGSIGVIMEFFQVQELSKKIGVSLEVLKSGEFKDIGSPYRELTERDKDLIINLISDIQEQFVTAVAEGRNIPVEKVREIADGRIISGAMAEKLGLVDQLGNFQDAVDLTKKMAGIEGDVSLVYPKERRIKLWDFIFQNATKALSRAVSDNLKPAIEYRWNGF
ncbi:signal peptide peptidase SppA [Deltaproteobacteria bacterium]|nr:signal peptide peptidase SppA [Deltaproteobacteria bacterium]